MQQDSRFSIITDQYSYDTVEFLLKQIQQAHQLKLSIQIYTNTPQTDKYHLTKEVWSTMEYMEPILQMFNQACNVFQSKTPCPSILPGNTQSANSLCKQEPPFMEASM
ncbi:hypothetical protein O181_065402 [Austropuccinia psidii MF-1]|uniref:Uncharacterized protein n=1 Tax=Austropuccinia psidii MF-1 TaxID=1389203 RepID=A0A9Q3I393_9BASI|nr:hypothetical protein [Austropuccinia psidii MF-1]